LSTFCCCGSLYPAGSACRGESPPRRRPQRRVKAHIFPQRSPRAAGRAAADAGGQYGKDKLTIGPGITIADRLPAAIIGISNYRFHDGLLL
jgi:hypothetical protein